MSHLKIPHRNFEYEDLFGNFLGVLTVFLIFILYKFLEKPMIRIIHNFFLKFHYYF